MLKQKETYFDDGICKKDSQTEKIALSLEKK